MNEMTIPYHLLIPAIIGIVALVAIFFFREKLFRKNKLRWTSVVVFLVLYLFIVGYSMYNDIYYQWDLNRYDLNKDGIFSGQEITKEYEAAMQRLVNDVGRNVSFITGFIFAFIISASVYVIGILSSKLKRYKK